MKPGIISFAYFAILKQKFSFVLLFMIIFCSILILSILNLVQDSTDSLLQKQINLKLSDSQVLLLPKVGILQRLGFIKAKQNVPNNLTPVYLEQLQQKNPDIKKFIKILYLTIPTSANARIKIPFTNFDESFFTDVFLAGIDPELFKNESFAKDFKMSEDDNFVPIIISKFLVNAMEYYVSTNFTENNNEQKTVVGSVMKIPKLTISFGVSSLFSWKSENPQVFEAKIIGSSKKTPLIFLGIPLNFAEKMFLEYSSQPLAYSEVIIDFQKPLSQTRLVSLRSDIEKKDLTLKTKNDILPFESKFLFFFNGIFYGVMIFVFLLVFAVIINFMLLFLEKNKKDIATFSVLGASRSFIYQLFMIQIGSLFLFAGGLVILLLFLLVPFVDQFLIGLSQKSLVLSLNSFLQFGWENIWFLMKFLGILFLVVFVFFMIQIHRLDLAKIIK